MIIIASIKCLKVKIYPLRADGLTLNIEKICLVRIIHFNNILIIVGVKDLIAVLLACKLKLWKTTNIQSTTGTLLTILFLNKEYDIQGYRDRTNI